MKNLMLYFAVCSMFFLTACSEDPTNARLFNSGGISLPANSGTGSDTAGALCAHPDAANFSKLTSKEPGPCIFYACKDPKFAEYFLYLDFLAYVDEYGGEIFHDYKLCKKEVSEICKHPESNYNPSTKKCEFRGCADFSYVEYQKYQDYKTYVIENGGVIIPDQSLCKTKKVFVGCKVPSAYNTTTIATAVEDKSCQWIICLDPNFEEYDEQSNLDKKYDLDQYAIDYGIAVSDLVFKNTCRTRKPIKGCTDSYAQNFNPNAIQEDKTCKYKFCSMPEYTEYDVAANLLTLAAAKTYVDNYGLSLDDVQQDNTCKTKKSKCIDPKATNYNQDGICQYLVCTNPDYKEYDVYLELKKLADMGKAKLTEANDKICKVKKVVPGCMEKDALNYNPKANYDDCKCEWAACNDPAFQEYDKLNNINILASILKYAEDHKMKVEDFIKVNTCKIKKTKCEHPKATNNGKYEKCHFEVCTNPDFKEYSFYEEVLKYINDNGGTYSDNAQKCVTQNDKPGCTIPSAYNFVQDATNDDKTCKWDVCLDCKYKEHTEPSNLSKVYDMNKYAADYNLSFHSLVNSSTCKTLKEKLGCTNYLAVNYDRDATIENGSCDFRACIDCHPGQYPEYDADIKYDILSYLLYNLKNHDIVYNTCEKREFMILNRLAPSCLMQAQGAIIRVSVNGVVKLETILTSAQADAQAVFVNEGDTYKVELISNSSSNTAMYSIYGYEDSVEGSINQSHIRHSIICE